MKIVFLDIDGVLNSGKNYQEYHEAQTNDPDKNPEVRGRIHMLHRHVEKLFDRENVSHLNTITEAVPETKVVVSSSWRRFYNSREEDGLKFHHLIELLKRVGVTAEIIDRTPCHLTTRISQRTSRGTEIHAWLLEHKDVSGFVILDDDDDMDHLRTSHVWTNGETGLTAEDAKEAILVLGGGYVPTRQRKRVL
jgi:hypothetical protein